MGEESGPLVSHSPNSDRANRVRVPVSIGSHSSQLGASPARLLVLPAKLLIASRTVTWPELAGAVLAYIRPYFLGGYQRRAALVAG